MQKPNDWDVSYSTISFFEKALKGHRKVRSAKRSRDILFTIEHADGSQLIVLLVNEYCLGMAAILRAKGEFPELDYIVTGGNWNGYTREAKEYGRQNEIGIFNTGEFFGALHHKDPKSYFQKDHKGNPIYPFKNS